MNEQSNGYQNGVNSHGIDVHAIIRDYVADLRELQKGNIPEGLERHARFLGEAIQHLPPRTRPDYEVILSAGLEQAKYLQAKQEAERLGNGKEIRNAMIDTFLRSH